jgi:hypothetical protein
MVEDDDVGGILIFKNTLNIWFRISEQFQRIRTR